MKIGVISNMDAEGAFFDKVAGFGLSNCQVNCWDIDLCLDEIADVVKKRAAATGVRIASFWGGWPGPRKWNFTEGPVTLGIVPREYRDMRVEALKRWAEFAARMEAPALVTHCGFIPENLTDPEYQPVVDAIADIAGHCHQLGIGFWFETGQETPVVLLRTIQQIGLPNLGINLDPANLLMYGKGNPIDALTVFGGYVNSIHVKDGLCPVNGESLGKELRVGEGMTRYPEFMKRLKEIGFDGDLIIEREISGSEQDRDIRGTITDLQSWI